MVNEGSRSRRWVGAGVIAVLLVAVVLLGLPHTRGPLLRSAGWFLVAADPIEPADIVVIATDSDGAGVLEAADLVHAGVAPRVAVFADPPDAVDREFLRRGVPYEDAAARSTRQLRWLGIEAIEQIPRDIAGSGGEGEALVSWCSARGIRSLVFVSTADHSRRLRRVLRRALKDQPTKVIVRPARHSPFRPEHWWKSRDGVRTEIIETQKLLLDFLRHPGT